MVQRLQSWTDGRSDRHVAYQKPLTLQGWGLGLVIMPLGISLYIFQNSAFIRIIKGTENKTTPIFKNILFFGKNPKSENRNENHKIGTLVHGASITAIK